MAIEGDRAYCITRQTQLTSGTLYIFFTANNTLLRMFRILPYIGYDTAYLMFHITYSLIHLFMTH